MCGCVCKKLKSSSKITSFDIYMYNTSSEKFNNISSIFLLQDLETNIKMTKVKIVRAEKLISGLGGEKERWTQV